jgi:DNA-binding MarR family transcriptional regulator
LSKGGAANANILPVLERLARLMRAGEHGGGLNPAQWEALRYLSRANRFSNSPVALARFLGSTKGTVSQTIKALHRKGYILKAAREGEKRSIALSLTDTGREMLGIDPLAEFSKSIDGLRGKTARRLDKGLSELLAAELARTKQPGFGVCAACRNLRGESGSYHCAFFAAALSDDDAGMICAEHST